MTSARIAGIGTALPPYIVDQHDVRAVIEGLFGATRPELDRLLQVFDHDHIRTRHFVRPISWYAEPHGFADCNAVYLQSAIELATQAAAAALSHAGISAADVDAIVCVSTTGIATPGIESFVAQALGCSPRTTRLPIVGLGCAGGVAGLARAAELCTARGGAPVLLIAVEICSTTFQRGVAEKSNIVASSIFGDGAAAVVLSGAGNGPRVGAGYSELFANSADVMGWDVIDTGLNVRFSRNIPDLVRSAMADVVQRYLAHVGRDRSSITSFIAHPGGAKVLDAYAEVLNVSARDVAFAKEVLRNYGNISSASVLFVLEAYLKEEHAHRSAAMCLALGPGFAAEFCLLEWT